MTQTASPSGKPQEEVPVEPPRTSVNKPVFIGSALGTVAVTLWCVIAPENAESTLGTLVGYVSEWFGWYYIALATGVLVFVLYLGFSRHGNVRLGPEHSRPEFSTLAWASMLFAAGIGTDLMFFAVQEPVVQYLTPPSGQGETVEAAREATVWTLFHYGISGWGMYALMGMALGYFAYRMNLPLAVRSALYPLIGRRIDGPIGHTVDSAAVLGTIFGVATSLGIGVVGLNVGLNRLFDVPQGLTAQLALLVLAVVIATISAVSGIDKGIKRLSQLNVLLAIGLALWILLTGKTAFLLNAAVLNVGDFVRLFPDMTMQTFAYEDTGDWLSFWTLFFWAWWIAWASFVGLFLARISRGRTIRQFVTGTMIIPFSYIVMWVSIFGNAAIDEVRSGNDAFAELASTATPENGFYALLQEYPAFTFVAGLATFVGLLFYVTSADSGALVMANLSSRMRSVNDDAGRRIRIFWAVATGSLTLAVLSVGGITALQLATVIMGLPFAFVLVLVMVGLHRALRIEAYRAESARQSLRGMLSGRSTHREPHPPRSWRQRVTRAMDFPSLAHAEEFLAKTALPALEEVAAELRGQDLDATARATTEDDTHYVELVVAMGSAHPFTYQIRPEVVPIPAYSRRTPRGDDVYARLEVHLAQGGQEYDVMGYTHTQLIDDVLDQYERHLEFLRLSQGAPG
ncbi:choline BCCT transporter BetT [Nocardioides sp. GCM10027113]|uniref:choline BCCT transporter BetT n=1 Tax=unclassified Nocardioides TaxID=2615069 RepID=UPI0036194218